MSRKAQFTLVLSIVVLLTAISSHLAVRWLRIRAGVGLGFKEFRAPAAKSVALIEGSSLMLDAISWPTVSRTMHWNIENWFLPGSSPSEWQSLQDRVTNATTTILVISPYDMNENIICDFHAEVTPWIQTVTDLWVSKSAWPHVKRALSQYPLKYIRKLFPTVGRSDGVMVGLREKARESLGRWISIKAQAVPTVGPADPDKISPEKKEKLSEWSEARLLRRLSSMKAACQGKQSFDGPKKLALKRMLLKAEGRGAAILVVLPVSPAYSKEFLTPEATQRFEQSLRDIQSSLPEVRVIRLDHLCKLDSDEYFWDLVHMNANGQNIATDVFLNEVRNLSAGL